MAELTFGSYEECTQHLTSIGIQKARELLTLHRMPKQYHIWIRSWIYLEEQRLADAAALRAEAREEMNLSISRKALRNSIWATIIAIIAMIIAAKDIVLDAMKWYSPK